MKDKIALDTNIAVEVLNNNGDIIQKLKKYQQIYLPATVCGELLFGAKNSGKKQENERKFQSFINACKILNINKLIAEEYAEIRKTLKDMGNPIPENDIWIAATCKVNQIPLASRDKHFEKIAFLDLLKI